MSRKSLFVLWIVLAWVTPAAIAGALGWKGVWGSGSAFVDYLIPIPVAGGVLHVPSFIVASIILFTQPWGGRLGGCVRGLLLAGALVGIATLLDLNKLHLAATTDAVVGSFWQEQPLGLFILSDCLIAQLFVGALGGRWPENSTDWGLTLAAIAVIPAAYGSLSLQADPRQQQPFVYSGSRPGPARSDDQAFYYSKLPVTSDGFRNAAAEVLARHDPLSNINSEDIAIHFFDSLGAAQAQQPDRARLTVCLYQDGTPTTWNPGGTDCFRDHESFSERRAAAYGAQDKTLPPDVRSWLARRDACAGRKPMTAPPGVFLDNEEVRACDPKRQAQDLNDLMRRFAQDEKVLPRLEALRADAPAAAPAP